MACEEEKLQVELLELLTEMQREAYLESYYEMDSARYDAEHACSDSLFLLRSLIQGVLTAEDMTEECVDALEEWIDAAHQENEDHWLLLDFRDTLEDARDRYGDCLHKASLPSDSADEG